MNENAVEIIVAGYNLPNLEVECLESITRYTLYRPYLITYFDNYLSGYTLTRLWNLLIGRSICPYIVLLNNDTKVFPFWLTKMMKVMRNRHDCGFVGPSTNNCHSIQKSIPEFEKATMYEGKVDEIVESKKPLSGFCLLFRREIWDKVGGFDENYNLYGQESDFVDKAHRLGYKSFWAKSAFVYHVGEASVKFAGLNPEIERRKALDLYWSTRKG